MKKKGYLLQGLQRLTKGNMINNKKMDCQPYRKRRPAVKTMSLS